MSEVNFIAKAAESDKASTNTIDQSIVFGEKILSFVDGDARVDREHNFRWKSFNFNLFSLMLHLGLLIGRDEIY